MSDDIDLDELTKAFGEFIEGEAPGVGYVLVMTHNAHVGVTGNVDPPQGAALLRITADVMEAQPKGGEVIQVNPKRELDS